MHPWGFAGSVNVLMIELQPKGGEEGAVAEFVEFSRYESLRKS